MNKNWFRPHDSPKEAWLAAMSLLANCNNINFDDGKPKLEPDDNLHKIEICWGISKYPDQWRFVPLTEYIKVAWAGGRFPALYPMSEMSPVRPIHRWRVLIDLHWDNPAEKFEVYHTEGDCFTPIYKMRPGSIYPDTLKTGWYEVCDKETLGKWYETYRYRIPIYGEKTKK